MHDHAERPASMSGLPQRRLLLRCSKSVATMLRPWESTGGRVLSPPMHVEFIRAHVQVCSICKRMFHDIVFGAPREPDEQHANTALQNKCCIILPVGATAEDI